MSEFLTLHEIYRAARERTEDGPWWYMMGGAETETTLRRNRQAIDSVAFRPRVLRDVSRVEFATTILGQPSRLPVFLAPIGSLQSISPGGALAAARGAEAFGVPSFLSSVTQPSLEEVAAGTRHPKVFQLYVRGDHAWVEAHVRRAIDSGYRGFCLTVDTAVYSRRERDLIGRYTPASRRTPEGHVYQAGMSWDLVKWYKDRFSLPLVLKGIATAEDARLALDHGAAAIYVSNHGGRQLDHGAGSLEMLPEIVAAVAGRAEVYVDGGFSRGTDILKALALGARAVGIGRLYGIGLAAAADAGVKRVLEILEDEISIGMALLGVTRLEELGPQCLRPATPLPPIPGTPSSAFPFLGQG